MSSCCMGHGQMAPLQQQQPAACSLMTNLTSLTSLAVHKGQQERFGLPTKGGDHHLPPLCLCHCRCYYPLGSSGTVAAKEKDGCQVLGYSTSGRIRSAKRQGSEQKCSSSSQAIGASIWEAGTVAHWSKHKKSAKKTKKYEYEGVHGLIDRDFRVDFLSQGRWVGQVWESLSATEDGREIDGLWRISQVSAFPTECLWWEDCVRREDGAQLPLQCCDTNWGRSGRRQRRGGVGGGGGGGGGGEICQASAQRLCMNYVTTNGLCVGLNNCHVVGRPTDDAAAAAAVPIRFQIAAQQIATASATVVSQTAEVEERGGVAQAAERIKKEEAGERGDVLKDAAAAGNLDRRRLPRHLAVIMDGNSRWAKKHFLPEIVGHERGVEALRKLVRLCQDWGIKALTVYAFSIENWSRPKGEVALLMRLFERTLPAELPRLERENVRVRFIGNVAILPPSLREVISNAEARTSQNAGLLLTIALSYGGRQDIVFACRHLAEAVAAGKMEPYEIDEAAIAKHLGMPLRAGEWDTELRDPDLLIRTSGECRLSNFLLWQLAYTELYFTPVLWPDFNEQHFRQALESYVSRDRRFGQHTQ
ncbi:hypothetical protein CBR_g26172 [Chara braunii]|uniref:Alkyl transferase n=1 Tax=Chara braunii TaxID=69332 RepID=A0A388L761_CHABU|nr:hypothetical protein CBR_g26172 [Chara braunii]|eukprot:GBG78136.1 hypothetical protein CBR_g26172 [Chara braunii]